MSGEPPGMAIHEARMRLARVTPAYASAGAPAALESRLINTTA